MEKLTVIIAAGGQSVRYGRNKLLEDLSGESVIRRSVRSVCLHASVDRVIVATSDPTIQHHLQSVASEDLTPITFCPGGPTRAHSVWSALKNVSTDVRWVAVHDAARPCVSAALITRTFSAAVEHGAAVPALPVQLTIKQAVGPLPAPVQRTVPRDQLFAMQTPQIMRRDDLLRAFETCPIPLEQVTDDVQLLELIGLPVWLVTGDECNIKITTPLDLQLAKWIVDNGV